ncbi:MAG: metallophosphatase family protein [Acidobacteria bacterium]|nr:metallophosphatase family protein [Acidobacteriota bacterium]
MIYALISDIHSNLYALQSAIREIRKRGIEKILVAGDICGKGPQPFEVLEVLKGLNCIAVKGNADVKFLSQKLSKNRIKTKEKYLLNYLSGLPATTLVDKKVLLCHGSPLKITDYIYPSITKIALLKKLNGFDPPKVLATGHSHIPFVKKIGETLVVNGGSVGKPIDGDPRGSLAIFELGSRSADGEIIRFDYNIDYFVLWLKNMDYSKKTILSYLEGTRNGRNR